LPWKYNEEPKRREKMEMVDLEKRHEKYLYLAVEKFLKTQKNHPKSFQ